MLIYFWAQGSLQNIAIHELQLHKSTVSEWYHRFRVACEEIVESKFEPLGGLNEEGESIIAEIDESKFFHRKYDRGQWRKVIGFLGPLNEKLEIVYCLKLQIEKKNFRKNYKRMDTTRNNYCW